VCHCRKHPYLSTEEIGNFGHPKTIFSAPLLYGRNFLRRGSVDISGTIRFAVCELVEKKTMCNFFSRKMYLQSHKIGSD
jgi:hypothetical protein